MKRKLVASLAFMLLLVWTAVGISAASAAPKKSSDRPDILWNGKGMKFPQNTFKANLNTKVKDGQLVLRVSLINVSGRSQSVMMGSRLLCYEFSIFNEKGEKISQWSKFASSGDRSSNGFNFRSFKPGRLKEMDFTETWSLRDDKGNKVKPGKYTAAVTVRVFPAGSAGISAFMGVTDAKKFTIKEKDLDQKYPKDDEEEKSQFVKTQLSARIEDGYLRMNFSLKNVSGRDLNLVFPDGQLYELTVLKTALNGDGQEIYKWSQPILGAINSLKLKKEEEWQFSREWDIRDAKGRLVPSGVYQVRVQFKASLQSPNGQIEPFQLQANQRIRVRQEEIKQVLDTTLRVVYDNNDDSLKLSFQLMNISGNDLTLRFNTSQKYDFWVADSKDNIVYKWSDGMDFLTWINYEDLKAGESLSDNKEWNLIGKNGLRVPAGYYTVTVQYKAKPETWDDANFPAAALTDSQMIYIPAKAKK